MYELFEYRDKKPSTTFQSEAIMGTHGPNEISRVFFSVVNIEALQQSIRYNVYVQSCKKHIIDRQSDTDLKVIMRAIYLEHASHDVPDVMSEIKRLNAMVINFCVPRILQEINMYMRYKADINKLPVPMDRGEFSSTKGMKSLVTKEF
jgi:hypothetical protein